MKLFKKINGFLFYDGKKNYWQGALPAIYIAFDLQLYILNPDMTESILIDWQLLPGCSTCNTYCIWSTVIYTCIKASYDWVNINDW